jgi:hypothetical protein
MKFREVARKRGNVVLHVNADLSEHLKQLKGPGAWVRVQVAHIKQKGFTHTG